MMKENQCKLYCYNILSAVKYPNIYMKILILLIHSKSDLYDNMLYVQQSYLLNNDIYDVFYVNMKETQAEPITIKNNVITVRGVESLTNILYKTVKALDYIINSLKRTYDYVVRGNISTLINRENLHTYLQSSPINELYIGGTMFTMNWKLAENEVSSTSIDREAYSGLIFVQGNAIIMSYDVVMCLLNINITYDIVDDVKIAILLKEYMPNAYNKMKSLYPANVSDGAYHHNAVFIRNKSNNRYNDYQFMQKYASIMK